jgi:acetyl esterase/lipase
MGHLEHRARTPERLRGRLRFWPALRFVGLALPTVDFSVLDPQRMMCTYGPAEGFTHSFVHAWFVWVNINAIRCMPLSHHIIYLSERSGALPLERLCNSSS